MSLSDITRQKVDNIVDEWETFAHVNVPAARHLSSSALRDEAKGLLLNIAADIESSQSEHDEHEKSRGRRPGNAPGVTYEARNHARDRFEQLFTLNDLVSEYRALRASVVRRWIDQLVEIDHATLKEFVRLSESMDQALTESIV